MGKNIFEMTSEELDNFFESKEGQDLVNDFIKEFEKEVDKESKKPHSYMFNQNCLCCWCKHNSHYKKDTEMGEITWCTLYKNSQPDDICKDREWLDMSSPF